ncbi:MAG: hypothetical protein V3T05_06915 [Myxococcota bacterium]
MRKRTLLVGLTLLALAGSDCDCNDSLGLAFGEIELALCDRGEACGCAVLEPATAWSNNIDFGSPATGGVARRILRLRNINQPRRLTVTQLEITDGADVFSITGLQKSSAEIDPETVESHTMDDGALVLRDEEVADLSISFRPGAAGEFAGTLLVVSDSPTRPRWEITLTGGGGSSATCVPAGDCGDGSVLDFGTFSDTQVGPDLDDPLGRPLALGTESITVQNEGNAEAFVTIELTDDGIPEVSGDDLPGMHGHFYLGALACTVVGPGETLDIPIEYRPLRAGEHIGEVTIAGVGAPVHIQLIGRVVGASICFRTEDDLPDDTTLMFGDAPTFTTPSNVSPPEERRIWVHNCGLQVDLTITDVSPIATSSPEFSTTALPWTMTGPLAPGAEYELPVVLTPLEQDAVAT